MEKNNSNKLYPSVAIIILLGTFWLILFGCRSKMNIQLYETNDRTMQLEYFGNWGIELFERNGLIVLEANEGFFYKNSARVEVMNYLCLIEDRTGPDEIVRSDIERIRSLYQLETMTIIQEPNEAQIAENEIVRAVIEIPTTAMKASARNQMGHASPDINQRVEIIAMTSNRSTLMAYIYYGNNEHLNNQAREIAENIHFNCATRNSDK